MFDGPPLPLSASTSISQLITEATPSDVIGAWVRNCTAGRQIIRLSRDAARVVLFSPDLGFLLSHCDRVALRERQRPVVLETAILIQWRALQVATGMPFLPGMDRLRLLFPDLVLNMSSVSVPLGTHGPEAVLAACVESGVQVSESRVIYVTPSYTE